MTEKIFGSNPLRDDTIQDQEAELQHLQTQITMVQTEMAATIKDLIHTQASNLLGESELEEIQDDIQTKRHKLVMTQIGVVLREKEL